MAKPKRSTIRIEYDRKEIAARYLKGETQGAIGEVLGLTQQMVSYDLQRIKEAWLESALVDYDEIKAQELARIDQIEREAWGEWQASKGEKTILQRDEKRLAPSDEVEYVRLRQKKEQRDGNPRFLEIVQWCVVQRCRIFGLYEPEKYAVVDWRQEAEQNGIDAGELLEQFINVYVTALDEGD